MDCVDDLCPDQNRIDGKMRARGMPPDTFNIDCQGIGRCHHRSRPDAKGAHRHARVIVHAVDLTDAEAIHQPVVDHFLSATPALFRRLENHHRGAGKVARLGEIACRAEQHGRVPVVTTCMHFPGDGGFVRNIIRLLDRQRIHIGAQPDCLARGPFAAADDTDHPGASEAGHNLIATESLELLGNRTRGAVHVE